MGYQRRGGYKLKDEIGRVDFGAGFGGGVSKSIGKMTLFGEARYVLGFTDINKLPAESKLKNRGVQITAGATVPLGK